MIPATFGGAAGLSAPADMLGALRELFRTLLVIELRQPAELLYVGGHRQILPLGDFTHLPQILWFVGLHVADHMTNRHISGGRESRIVLVFEPNSISASMSYPSSPHRVVELTQSAFEPANGIRHTNVYDILGPLEGRILNSIMGRVANYVNPWIFKNFTEMIPIRPAFPVGEFHILIPNGSAQRPEGK